jgi:hypothetical protein
VLLIHSASSGEGRKFQGRGYNRLHKSRCRINPEKADFTFTTYLCLLDNLKKKPLPNFNTTLLKTSLLVLYHGHRHIESEWDMHMDRGKHVVSTLGFRFATESITGKNTQI